MRYAHQHRPEIIPEHAQRSVFPDTAALFPRRDPCPGVCGKCPACATSSMFTPRNAMLLYLHSLELSVRLGGDIGSRRFDTWPLAASGDDLSIELRERFVGSVASVYARIARGEVPAPRCQAEGDALVLVAWHIEDAWGYDDWYVDQQRSPFYRSLPRSPYDFDLDFFSELVPEEVEYLMPYAGLRDEDANGWFLVRQTDPAGMICEIVYDEPAGRPVPARAEPR